MFPSHRPFVHPSAGSTRLFRCTPPSLSLVTAVRPPVRPRLRPSVFIPFNHCVMPFACRPRARPPARACLSSETEPTVRPSVRPFVSSLSIRPSLRPGKALKAASSSPSDATPQPMGEREGELTLLYFFADSISGSAGNNYLARPPVVPCPSGREGERNKKEKKALS